MSLRAREPWAGRGNGAGNPSGQPGPAQRAQDHGIPRPADALALSEEGGVNESSSGVHGQQMSPLRSPGNDRPGRSFARTSPPAESASHGQLTIEEALAVRT